MGKVIVEVLVKASDSIGKWEGRYRKGDVITVQAPGTDWGRGDLTGNIMFCVEIDIPCGKYVSNNQCEGCPFGLKSVTWKGGFPPKAGDKGYRNRTCKLQDLLWPEVEYEWDGETFKSEPLNKSANTIDLDALTTISSETLGVVASEKPRSKEDFISLEEVDVRKANARKSSNIVAIDKFVRKDGE